MKKYEWEEDLLSDGCVKVVMGKVSFVIRGLEDLNPTARADSINALIDMHVSGNVPTQEWRFEPEDGAAAQTPKAVPPVLAETLLAWFSPKASCNEVMGDLQELLEADTTRLGDKHARRRYWMRVLRNVGPSIWQRILGLGIVTAIISYGRSKLGW